MAITLPSRPHTHGPPHAWTRRAPCHLTSPSRDPMQPADTATTLPPPLPRGSGAWHGDTLARVGPLASQQQWSPSLPGRMERPILYGGQDTQLRAAVPTEQDRGRPEPTATLVTRERSIPQVSAGKRPRGDRQQGTRACQVLPGRCSEEGGTGPHPRPRHCATPAKSTPEQRS